MRSHRPQEGILTVTALMAQGITESSLKLHLQACYSKRGPAAETVLQISGNRPESKCGKNSGSAVGRWGKENK